MPKDIRNKDREVHAFMKKKNVHLGYANHPVGSVAKSHFISHAQNIIDEMNDENPMNSNFKQNLYIGSPKGNRKIESKLLMYGERVADTKDSSKEMNLKNKQLKRELLSHTFNLGYGYNTHKRAPSTDVIQHMKKNYSSVKESPLLKNNQNQNFKYSEDVSQLNYKIDDRKLPNHQKYLSKGGKVKAIADYWKTNFTFNQVPKKTGAGSFNNSMDGGNNVLMKNSLRSTKSGFSDMRRFSKDGGVDRNYLLKNQANSLKSNVINGLNKNDFSTSYNKQFMWKVAKVKT